MPAALHAIAPRILARGAALLVWLATGTSVGWASDAAWSEIRSALFGAAAISESGGVIEIMAPERAEDAAVVPVSITLPAGRAGQARKVSLIVDENPAPVAAVISFGPASGSGERQFQTRLRLDRFTFVRAVAELDDGTLHMATRFVKASGGCSAPASKDADAALAELGKVQVTTVGALPGVPMAQVNIRHPNFTGMQIDPITRGYTPSRFVEQTEIRRGDELLLSIESGIAISENPSFRFTYAPSNDTPIIAKIRDTTGHVFTGSSRRDGS